MPDSGAEPEVRLVLVTGPDRKTLEALGRVLVQERLVACANVLGGVTSVYRWEGAVERAEEALALLKTTRERLAALEARVRSLHPYDEPEVVVLRVEGGSASYLAWVVDSVRGG